jgi:hypothetical protein
MGKLSTAEVLRLRAPTAVLRDKAVTRSAQDDNFVGIPTNNILNKLALMGRSPVGRINHSPGEPALSVAERGRLTAPNQPHSSMGIRRPDVCAKLRAAGYPASTCRSTPIPGSVVSTRSRRSAASSVPSATTTIPACCE